MKNKIFEVFVCMLLIGTCFVVTINMISAEDLVEGNYKYTVNNGEATVTGYTGAGGAITIPSTLGGYPTVAIGNGTFLWYAPSRDYITSVIIPDGVTTIGSNAFGLCSSMTSVTIPDSVITIADSVFASCGSLTSITIPNSVTTLGKYVFNKCYALPSITIPDSVTTLDDEVFEECSSMTSVTMGKGVTTIGTMAFRWCNSLTSVTIPNSVTTIGAAAFENCQSLTSVTIGNGVTTIGSTAFTCISLVSITFRGLVAPTTVGALWIDGTPLEIRGHSSSNSDFPAPEGVWNGLTMGEYLVEENEPPVAGFTWTPSTPKANQTITFDATASNDTDGSIAKYEWDWNNDGIYDNSYTTQTATNSWPQAGSYPVTLRVTDNSNATNTKKITVTVSSGGGNGDTDNKKTPGFELILVILAITMIMFLKRKRKNSG
jgi:hypothetical protein